MLLGFLSPIPFEVVEALTELQKNLQVEPFVVPIVDSFGWYFESRD